MRHLLFSLAACLGFSSHVLAQDLQVNGVKFGISIQQAQQTLGPGFKMAQAHRNDGIEQAVLFKQNVAYGLLSIGQKIYYISYSQYFPQGQELNAAQVESQYVKKFGTSAQSYSHNFNYGFGYDENLKSIPPAGCGFAPDPAFPNNSQPAEVGQAMPIFPASVQMQSQQCPYEVQVHQRNDPANSQLISTVTLSMFYKTPLRNQWNGAAAAAQQKQHADADAAKKNGAPF